MYACVHVYMYARVCLCVRQLIPLGRRSVDRASEQLVRGPQQAFVIFCGGELVLGAHVVCENLSQLAKRSTTLRCVDELDHAAQAAGHS